MKEDNYNRFLHTYSGKSLLERHRLDEDGYWQIKGEDPNCDFGGSHHSPDLGIVQGRLQDVIIYAVDLPKFWQWGAGGDIRKIDNIPRIDSDYIKNKAQLLRKKSILESELKSINEKLV